MNISEWKIILLFFLFGILLWIADSIADYYFFFPGQGSFLDILLLHPPPHELYVRISALVLLILFGFAFSHYIKELKRSRTRLQNVFNNVIPICITNREYEIIGTNSSYDSLFASLDRGGGPVRCHDERPGDHCRSDGCPVVEILEKGAAQYTCETVLVRPGMDNRYFIVRATPFLDREGRRAGIIETFQDITPRKQLEREKETLIGELQEALARVKVLSGFLPICASCKKIRDDKGYWTQIETYIRNHSEAEFSHGICPDCAEKHFPFTRKH